MLQCILAVGTPNRGNRRVCVRSHMKTHRLFKTVRIDQLFPEKPLISDISRKSHKSRKSTQKSSKTGKPHHFVKRKNRVFQVINYFSVFPEKWHFSAFSRNNQFILSSINGIFQNFPIMKRNPQFIQNNMTPYPLRRHSIYEPILVLNLRFQGFPRVQ